MEIIVFEKEAYYKMLAEVKRTIAEAFQEGKVEVQMLEVPKEKWITPAAAQKILTCKKDKLRELRLKGEITISKNGRLVLYSVDSLHEYLNRNAKR